MAHILIATDLSASSMNAALYAMRLFGPKASEYTLLHCYQGPFASERLIRSADDDPHASVRELGLFRLVLEAELPGDQWRVFTASRPGRVSAAIRQFMASPQAPALAVMGTRASTGLASALLGSNTAAVIKRGIAPVLAIPPQAVYKGIKNVLLAMDEQRIDQADLGTLKHLMDHTGARLHVLRIVNEEVQAMPANGPCMANGCTLAGIPHHHLHASGLDVQEVIHHQAALIAADLVAVVHHARLWPNVLLQASTSAHLMLHSELPMLVLQQQRR